MAAWHTGGMPLRPLPTAACLLVALLSAPAAGAANPQPPATPVPAARPATTRTPAPSRPVAPGPVAPKPPAPGSAAAASTAAKPAAAKPTAAKPTAPKPATPKPTAPKPVPYGVLALKPGEYVWTPEAAPTGPVVVVVSLPQQRVHVYRNGARIGVSTISSGRRGYETPTGTFPIIERQTEHYSNKYDSAPMPFMLRLTMDGVAMHAGHLPGYPASHGCVRLPAAFAETLFGNVRRGTVVVVADAKTEPADVAAPGWVTPVAPATGVARDPVDDALPTLWAPERAPDGPLTAVVSARDGRLVVLRNGIEIGHAPAEVVGEPWTGTRAYALRAVPAPAPAVPLVPAAPVVPVVVPAVPATAPATATAAEATSADAPTRAVPAELPPPVLRWEEIAISLAPVVPAKGTKPAAAKAPAATAVAAPPPVVDPISAGRLRIDPAFALRLREALGDGTTLIVTDDPLRRTAPAPAPPPKPASPPAPPVTPITPSNIRPPTSA